MAEYKLAKEAFHANNSGSSIWSINAVSFAALSSYMLYATISRRLRPSPLVDFTTMALPILLSVTVISDRPVFFNCILLALAAAVRFTSPRARYGDADAHESSQSGHTTHPAKSKGKWLDESDSDEEPAQPPTIISSNSGGSARLRTPISMSTSTARANSSDSSSLSSPSLALSLSPDTPALEPHTRSRKKRHSPTPSTHTHTAINILPTPEMDHTRAFSSQQRDTYPSPRQAEARVYAHADVDGDSHRSSNQKPKLPFLSVYRAHMMLMTIHCILAVDFPVFPRWQGKCETFGTSLMDVGVGSFVFSLGVVSTRSFASRARESMVRRLSRAVWKAAPILALGMVRVVMVKGVEYPEHVTEYGVHWNFFFTLGLLPVFGTLLWPARSFVRWSTLGLVVALLHEAALYSGLQSWIVSGDSRIGLLGMNKEGIVSLPGYLAIYLLGLATGQHILRSSLPLGHANHYQRTGSISKDEEAQRHHEKRQTELALELFSYSVAWWTALAVLRLTRFEVSRRMANLPYILWTAAYNTSFLFAYLLIEMTCFSSNPESSTARPVPPLLEAINKNGLVVFLLANLLTGLVNLSMKTMWASDIMAMGVLIGYSLVICGAAWAGRRRSLKLG